MKIGVVGYGSIGSRHARNLHTLGHDVLIYDPAIIGLNDKGKERMIYGQCDAVVIATPTPFHAAGLLACVELGKHVFVEKPIATKTEGIAASLVMAAEKDLIVMMGNNLRFHPCVQQAKEWIAAGEIGTPIWAQFTCGQLNRKYTDSVVLNWGAHEVDMALHLLGPARVVTASVAFNAGGGIEDIADFLLIHDNGCRSSFHLDYVTPNEIREAWIVGDKERIGLELRNRNASLGTHAKGFGGSFDDDYFLEMKAFVDRIENKITPGATGGDGLAALDILLDVRSKAGVEPR